MGAVEGAGVARGGVRTRISYSVRPFRAKSSRSSASRIEPEFDLSRRLKMRTRSSSVANLGIALCCRAESATRHQLLSLFAYTNQTSTRERIAYWRAERRFERKHYNTVKSDCAAQLEVERERLDASRWERLALSPVVRLNGQHSAPNCLSFVSGVLCLRFVRVGFDFPADNRAYIRVQIFIFGVAKAYYNSKSCFCIVYNSYNRYSPKWMRVRSLFNNQAPYYFMLH